MNKLPATSISATTMPIPNDGPIEGFRHIDMNEYKTMEDIERAVSLVMRNELGFVPKHIGFAYMKTCVAMCIINPEYKRLTTKTLYPDCAKKYSATSCAIERGIRYMASTIKYSDEMKEKVFGYVAIKYSNKHMINCLAEFISCRL